MDEALSSYGGGRFVFDEASGLYCRVEAIIPGSAEEIEASVDASIRNGRGLREEDLHGLASRRDSALIERVRNYPFLFEKTSPLFRNKEAKKNAWKKIGEELGMNGSSYFVI